MSTKASDVEDMLDAHDDAQITVRPPFVCDPKVPGLEVLIHRVAKVEVRTEKFPRDGKRAPFVCTTYRFVTQRGAELVLSAFSEGVLEVEHEKRSR